MPPALGCLVLSLHDMVPLCEVCDESFNDKKHPEIHLAELTFILVFDLL